MKLENNFLGRWIVEKGSAEVLCSAGIEQWLDMDADQQATPYQPADRQRILSALQGAQSGAKARTLLVQASLAGEKPDLHLLHIRPLDEGGKISGELHRKPNWNEVVNEKNSHTRILNFIISKVPENFLSFSPDGKLMSICQCWNPENERFDLVYMDNFRLDKLTEVDISGAECLQALEKVKTEKRVVIIELPSRYEPDQPQLLVFEPMLNEDHEIIAIFLFIYNIAGLPQSESFILNQFIAMESAMDGIALLNEKGEYYYLNDMHVKMFGYETQEELLGKTWQSIYGQEEIQRIGTDIFPQLMANRKWNGETIGLSKQGMPVYQDISLTSLPNGGLICVCRDVSHRIYQENRLQLNDRVLRSVHSMVLISDAEGRLEWVNEAFTHTTGYTLEDVKGRKPGSLLQGPDSDPQLISMMRQKVEAHQPFECEIINYTRAGKPYWVEIKCQPLFGRDGKLEKYFAIEQDVTYRKQALLEIKQSSDRLQLALGAFGNAVWEWDPRKEKPLMVNFHEMLGYDEPASESDWENYFESLHPEDRSVAREVMNQYAEGLSESNERQERMLTRQGSYIWVMHRSRVVETDAQGKPLKILGTLMNISPLKAVEERLAASEERWKKALEGSGNGICEIDFEKGTVWYSQRALESVGYTRMDEVNPSIGWMITQVHPDDRAAAQRLFVEHLKGESDHFAIEARIQCNHRAYCWFALRGIVSQRDKRGRATRFIGSSYNIDDRKIFEEKLRLSEERWKFAIDGASAGVFDWNVPQSTVYYSDTAKRLLGIEAEGNLFDAAVFFESSVHPEDLPEVKRVTDQLIDGRLDRADAEYRIRNASGSIYWIEDRAMVIERDKAGMATRIIGIFFDITEKKSLYEKLLESEERWIFALEGSSSGVWDYNLETGAVFYSQKLKELMGLGPDDPFPQEISTYEKLIHPEDKPKVDKLLQQYLSGESDKYENEQRALHKDGTYHWYLNKGIIADRDAAGKPIRLIGTVTDITPRKINELELIKARDLAETSARAKRTFLANMSHEIRTPMNAILGLSEQLDQTALTNDQQFLVNIISDAAKSLKVLIDDILDFSKIEEGKLKLEMIDFDLEHQLKRVVNMLLHQAQEKNLSLSLDFDWQIERIVKGDPNRLSQILINIIGNAIKFTQKGFIQVRCSLQEKDENRQQLSLEVSDTGVGMSSGSIDHIFNEFYQEDQSIARKFGGTGLGLSISKNLIEMMGGTIAITSEKNKGTTVKITLPFEISDRSRMEPSRTEQILMKELFRGKKILLVEDNKVNRIVAGIILKKMGMEVAEAENGKVALQLLEYQCFDLILMDLQMPEMDGISTIRLLRKHGIQTPVIALTANAVQEELEELIPLGFNRYVVKPFEEKKLLLAMQEELQKITSPPPTPDIIPGLSGLPVCDLKRLMEQNANQHPETEQALARAMLYELDEACRELSQAIGSKHWRIVKEVAHKQKSMILSLGLKDESASIHYLSKLDVLKPLPPDVEERTQKLLTFFEETRSCLLKCYPFLNTIASKN